MEKILFDLKETVEEKSQHANAEKKALISMVIDINWRIWYWNVEWGVKKGENTKIPRWFSLYRLFMLSRCLKNEHEKDVKNEKWLLPGSRVVVVVVASSAYINLAFNAIKISKMKMPFDGKLLSFMMESFVISSLFYFFLLLLSHKVNR